MLTLPGESHPRQLQCHYNQLQESDHSSTVFIRFYGFIDWALWALYLEFAQNSGKCMDISENMCDSHATPTESQ